MGHDEAAPGTGLTSPKSLIHKSFLIYCPLRLAAEAKVGEKMRSGAVRQHVAKRQLHPVIMCGGSGTRLWPASQAARPKQFLRLTGTRSMFQQTVLRLEGLVAGRPVIIGNIQHAAAIETQLAEIGVPATILLEPCVRDSAPAIAAAIAAIAQEDPDAIAVVVASDHYIPDDAAFCEAVRLAAEAAEAGHIVTLGIRADQPSTAYGYIRPRITTDGLVIPVEAFIEKPDALKAAAYVDAGYLWNSGNFIFAVDTMLNELDRHAPEVAYAAKRAVRDAEREGRVLRLASSFASAPKISIDYAVMEKTALSSVLPVDFFWSDLGAWDAVHGACAKDLAGNSTSGDCLLVNTERALVRNDTGVPVATVGMRDVAIIVEPAGVLVCDLASSQVVKDVAEKLSVNGRSTGTATSFAESLAAWAQRYEHLFATSTLPLWWALGADHTAGGFHEALSIDGIAVHEPRRARVQARQTWVYARAVDWQGPAREAALHGMRWFRAHYLKSDGLFRTLVGPHGRALDETATLYDQAFALLAMAALHAMPHSPEGTGDQAIELLGAIGKHMRHEAGGFREAGSSAFQSNPHMHLLEAALAWSECGGGKVWDELADEIVTLALSRFIDTDESFLREHFTASWEPALGERGRLVEPGHQFEWAHLLARWSKRTGEQKADAAARRLFAAGAVGIDPVRDVAVDALNEDMTVRSARARLWPQTERLRAALALHTNSGDTGDLYLAHAVSAAESLWRYLDMPTRGLWRDKLLPTNRFVDEPAPASSLYHIAGAVDALKDYRAAQTLAVSLAAQ